MLQYQVPGLQKTNNTSEITMGTIVNVQHAGLTSRRIDEFVIRDAANNKEARERFVQELPELL